MRISAAQGVPDVALGRSQHVNWYQTNDATGPL
jgi:hypothetical protein